MSKIEWTDETWNPFVGCSLASPGCTNCYAMKMAARLEAICEAGRYDCNGYVVRGGHPLDHYLFTTKMVKGKPVWTGKVNLAPASKLIEPLRWKKPRMVFVNSMSDLFHESVPDEWIDKVFAVMGLCPQHTFQVLTKRSARMRAYLSSCKTDGICWEINKLLERSDADERRTYDEFSERVRDQLPNVWLGVSCEDQRRADERVPDLLETPAAVRFISAEPLLGTLDLREWLIGHEEPGLVGNCIGWTPPLDWIIVGGESGNDARPMHPDWARSIRDQCTAAGVAFFFKQWGAWAPLNSHGDFSQGGHGDGEERDISETLSARKVGKARAGRLLDGREWNEMPATHPAREVAV